MRLSEFVGDTVILGKYGKILVSGKNRSVLIWL